MKKIIILLIIAGSLLFLISNIRLVSFSAPDAPASTEIILSRGEGDTRKIKENEKVWAIVGVHSVSLSHEFLSKDSQDISIKRGFMPIDITLDTTFSDTFLRTLTPDTEKEVIQILKKTYPDIIDNYTLTSGKNHMKGEYYTGILNNTSSIEDDRKDFYRFVAKKESQSWKIIYKPSLVISKEGSSSIPKDVITSINNTSPY